MSGSWREVVGVQHDDNKREEVEGHKGHFLSYVFFTGQVEVLYSTEDSCGRSLCVCLSVSSLSCVAVAISSCQPRMTKPLPKCVALLSPPACC